MAIQRRETLRQSLNENRTFLKQRIDATPIPRNVSGSLSSAYMHRFERTADLAPGALIRSVRDTAWYSACQSAPEQVEKVARQLEVQRGVLHHEREGW